MPEGVETEVVRRSLEPWVLGAALVRPTLSGLLLRGQKLDRRALRSALQRPIHEVRRHGKVLWLRMADGAGLAVRLGMTGRLLVRGRGAERPKHTHVVLELEGRERELWFVDPRRFGDVRPFHDDVGLTALTQGLGVDVLSLATAVDDVVEQLGRTRRRLKDALLDQALIAGVGNIYACEALFAAELQPTLRGHEVKPAALAGLVRAVAAEAIRGLENGGTSFKDFVDANGQPGDHQSHLRVFLREGKPCLRCRSPIERMTFAGRSTWWCPRCQGGKRVASPRRR